jgi:hypothetical protein
MGICLDGVTDLRASAIRSELLRRTTETGREGQIARVLDQLDVSYFRLEGDDFKHMLAFGTPPLHVIFKMMAMLRPLGTMWLEYMSGAGHDRALLCWSTEIGELQTRVLRRRQGEPAFVLPAAMSRRCPPLDEAVDWSAFEHQQWTRGTDADRYWTNWMQSNLVLETFEENSDPMRRNKASLYGMRDLVYLAYALSPLFVPDLGVLSRSAGM